MRSRRAKVDLYKIENANYLGKSQVERFVELAKKYQTDPERKERLAKCECLVCFYQEGRIGGAAVTFRQCALCDVVMMSGNTCVDTLCGPCAKEHKLCRHCGADLEYKNRRNRKPLVATETLDEKDGERAGG